MKTEDVDPMGVLEGQIAVLKAQILSSSLNRARDVKEPFDGPCEMRPVAYAMFEVLAEIGMASGQDEDWWEFLQLALNECVNKAREDSYR